MQSTRQHNQVTQKYSIDEYLQLLKGAPVDEDSLLRKACEKVWDVPPDDLKIASKKSWGKDA